MQVKLRIEVPEYAKKAAREALRKRKKLPESERFGLSKKEAKKKGITSGVARAEQLINSKYITFEDAQDIANFYSRFKNCKTSKCEGAIGLWGGRKFGKRMNEIVDSAK